jgi:hypothetical protein
LKNKKYLTDVKENLNGLNFFNKSSTVAMATNSVSRRQIF